MHQKGVIVLGFALSVALHALVLSWGLFEEQPISAKSAQPKTTVTLNFTPPPPPKEEPKPVPPKPEPKPKPKPKPIPKPLPKPKPKPVQKPVKHKPVEKKPIKRDTPPPKPASAQQEKSAISTDEIEARKNRFLQQLRERIKSNKSYPNIARRRGIQGEVTVRFFVLSNGEVGNVTILSGKKIFRKAVNEAIVNSFPITPPKELFSYPLEVSLTLAFRLR